MTSANAHFVIGTDTGIGKTLVSCALIHALRQRGVAAVGMKPVAAGAWRDALGRLRNDDADALATASVGDQPPSLTSPYLFAAPLAPNVAARREGRRVERQVIIDAFNHLCATAGHVIVEGVGGFLVPLADDYTTADLAVDLAAPLVLVVGLRLGCMNHALMTAEAARSRGLRLVGWVANCQPGGMLEQDACIATLAARLEAPLWAVVPRLASPDPVAVSAAFDSPRLFPDFR